VRRPDRDHDRRLLCDLGRDGGRARPLPRLQEERRAHAARHPQPSPRGPWRGRGYEGLAVTPVALDHGTCPRRLLVTLSEPPASPGTRARARRKHGYRNAQATVIAPTGTIGLVMDCDTTGIEPDFALVKFKKLAGGGYWKIINRAVPDALRALGYREARSPRSRPMPSATARWPGARHQCRLAEGQGLHRRQDRRGREGLKAAFDIKFVFNKWTLGEDFLVNTLKVPGREARRPPSSCCPSSASPRPRSRPPTSMSAAR
jgi:ribonucleoside-diphosphate reductase alpha chain